MNRLSVFAGQVRNKITPNPRTRASALDFQDVSPPSGFQNIPYQQMQDESAPPVVPPFPVFPKPLQLQRNKTERTRLQGVMQKNSSAGTEDVIAHVVPVSKQGRFRHWFVNEGGRRTFFALWMLVHALVFAFGMVHYSLKDNLNTARETFGWTFAIARACALVLHVQVAILLLPVCRNFLTLIRRTQLNSLIPFDANITFHKSIGWGILLFSTIHTLAHMRNFYRFASITKTGFVGFLKANFATGPGITGWLMTVVLGVMIWFAIEKRKRAHFNRFWYSHHLFIFFFALWQLHGMFCMIPNDNTKKCDYWQVGVFWKYFLVSGVLFVYERVLREVRSRHRTYISKIVEHPGDVIEVQIKKEHINPKAGQYIFLNCPSVSYFQWHPFTLTSAPEEDFISVNIKMVGDWTKSFGSALGCELNEGKRAGRIQSMDVSDGNGRVDNVYVDNVPTRKVLPRIMVDGPFGRTTTVSQEWTELPQLELIETMRPPIIEFEVVMLCAAGIGVTPFASILKSIWYRMNYPKPNKKTLLSKIYFIHICRDTVTVSWFRSLLAAIEAQDTNGSIEIMTYVTQTMKNDDLTNIMLEDVGNDKDAITGLRAPTHYGRPNWNTIFSNITDKHPNTEVGTLFCGPKPLGTSLHKMCNKWSSTGKEGTKFIYMKENF